MTHPDSPAERPDYQKLFAPLALALLLGCGHTEPFATPPAGTDQPFDPSPPVRLTLNQGPDRGASWLPDGSGILYSAQQLGRDDHDVCLALIPPGGGTQRWLTCDPTPAGGDSTDAFESPAASSSGRLAFVTLGSRIDAIAYGSGSIAIGTLADPVSQTRLQSLPYTVAGNHLHSGASQLRWLSPTRLVYLGERVDYHRRCERCVEWDTMVTGRDVAWIDVTQPGSGPQLIPGTDNASSVSLGSSEDEVYYTLNADPRVYRQTLSTGAVTVVHDFGPLGSARDVHVVGPRMAAVVGGRVAYGIDPLFGPTQWDSGGVVHVVDLQSGTDVALDGPGLFRRPQISPSGSAIVAEGYPLIFTDFVLPDESVQTDTTVSRRGDLFLFGQP
jgi:hypothetical protein